MAGRALPRRRSVDSLASESWRIQVYHPLSATKRQIRILRLFPSTNLCNDPEGELCVLDLDDKEAIKVLKLPHGKLYDSENGLGTFAAVSYRWGEQADQRHMILSGWKITVGKNAHDALRYLRRCDASINIWMDALCINQQDKREKSMQLPLMGEIYSIACPVYIWTGLGVKSSYKALGMLSRMTLVMAEVDSEGDPQHFKKKWAVWKAMRTVSDSDWQHLLEFVELEIWNRVWVQQEIILSSPNRKMAVVVAGKFHQNHFTVIYGLRAISTAWTTFGARSTDGAIASAMEKACLLASTITLTYNNWSVRGTISDELLFSVVLHLQATNPADLVYGLLGLLPWLASQPDYDKPLSLIYTEATFALLTHSYSLAPLLGISYHWRILGTDLPSWALNWNNKVDQGNKIDLNFSQRWAELHVVFNADNGYPMLLERDHYWLGVAVYPLFVLTDICLGPRTEFDYQTIKPPIDQRDFASARLGYIGHLAVGEYPVFDDAFEKTLLLDLDLDFLDGGAPIRRLIDARIGVPGSQVDAAREMIRAEVTGKATEQPAYSKVFRRMCDRLRNTRIAVSPRRHLCIVPAKTEADDVVCIVAGSTVPLVLRRRNRYKGRSEFEIVGGAYVNGVMDGEAIIRSAPDATGVGGSGYNTAFDKIWLV